VGPWAARPPPIESYSARAEAFVAPVVKEHLGCSGPGAGSHESVQERPADALPTMTLRHLQLMEVEHRRTIGSDQVIAPAPSGNDVTVRGDEGESARTFQVRLTAPGGSAERLYSSFEEPDVRHEYSADHTSFCTGWARSAGVQARTSAASGHPGPGEPPPGVTGRAARGFALSATRRPGRGEDSESRLFTRGDGQHDRRS